MDVGDPILRTTLEGPSPGGGEVCEGLHALGVVDRHLHGDDGAGGGAGQVNVVDAEAINQLDDVAGQALEAEWQRGVRHLGPAVATQTEAHHAKSRARWGTQA